MCNDNPEITALLSCQHLSEASDSALNVSEISSEVAQSTKRRIDL